jgi:PAS domain S-box-containing protein
VLVSDVTEQNQAERAAEKAHQRLLDAIESLPAGFSLYDKDERLVISNSVRRELSSWHGDLFAPGATFEQILRDSANQGAVKGIDTQDAAAIEAFVAKRLEDFRNPAGKPFELQRSDGMTVLSLFHKTSDGGTVSIALDITEQKRAEQAARTADQRLRDAIESMPAGFSLYDEDERLIITNSRRQGLTHWNRELVAPGVRFETLVRNSAASGAIVGVDKDDAAQCEQYVVRRLETFRNATGEPFEIRRKDGTSMLSLFHKTSDGGTVAVLLDVTDQKQAEQAAARSHQRLIDAIESMPAGFRIFDAEERLVLWNSKYEEQTRWHHGNIPVGITFEEILERTVTVQGLVDKAEQDETYISKRVAEFRNPGAAPYELRRSDGKIFLTIYRKTADGGRVHVMVDITELKQAEQALKASEARLNTILDLAPEAIVTVDEDYRIRLFNAGAQRLFGYEAATVFGQNLELLFSEREHEKFFDTGEASGEPGMSVWKTDGRREMIARHETGREFPVEISVAETVTDDATLHTVLLHDISERKHWEEEVRQAMHLAESANRAKTEFLSHMSHELRTPLNGILGYAEFIQQKWLGDDALDQYVEYAGFIRESGQHLLQLINDILDLSKIEAGHYEMMLEEIEIDDLFDECRHIVAADAEKERIAIEFNVRSGSSHWTADRRALKQILINLLSNALKFSDAGSRIIVESSRGDTGHYRLEVRDSGIGMTEEESRRALEPFIQVGTPYVASQKGTGLGLALVVRFVALHGGSVDIKSTPQVGTTVQVTLPPLPRNSGAIEPPKQISA